MIRTATSILNDLVTAMPVGVRHALVEVVDGVPSVHAGHGQFVPVINDAAGGVSYWRADGAAPVTDISGSAGCANAVRVSMPVALIGFVRRDQCDDMEAVLQAAVIQLRGALKPLRNSITGVFGASIGSVSIGVDVVRTSEIKDFLVPASLAVLSMRFVLSIDGADDCLAGACTPGDPVCTLIQGLRWNRIEMCLTQQQTDDAINSLCGGGGPRDPFTITINGPSNVFADVDDPCGESLNITVSNTDGDLVGSEVDGSWQIGNAMVLRDGVPYGSVEAEGSIDVPSDCSPCPPTKLRLQFAQYSNEVQFDFDAASAGTYGAPTDDGSSGTITWSMNGGAFGAWPGDTAFANGDYVSARRTTTSAIGWAQITQ